MADYKTDLQSNNIDLQSMLDTINELPDAVSEVEQATPTITVSSNGLITASATQAEGKVIAGTKTATKQLTTKTAATYTPSTSDQTIAAGTYLTGAQIIKGDSNLVSDNIVSGKSIFGVEGTSTGGKKSFSTIVTTTTTTSITISIPDGYDTSNLPNHVIIDNATNKRLCHFAYVDGTMQALISNGTGTVFNGLLTSNIIMEYNGSSLTVGLNSMAFLDMNATHTVVCVWDTEKV